MTKRHTNERVMQHQEFSSIATQKFRRPLPTRLASRFRSLDVGWARRSGTALVLMMGAFVFATAGCGDDGAASGCRSDSECVGSRVCVEGACVPDEGNNGPNNGTNNGPNNNNGTNNGPNNGTDDCRTDGECPLGEVCDNTTCGERACDGDVDCGSPNRFCNAGQCQIRTSCTESADCSNGWVCDGDVCRPPCVIDADCDDPQAQACTDAGLCRDRCAEDVDCPRELICTNQVCGDPECFGSGTAGCDEGERCQASRCEPFTPCDIDSDCPAEEQCLDNICEPRDECIGDAQCGEGQQCRDGFCYVATPCDVRGDCSAGEDCVGGFCVPFVCRGTIDCEDGEICEEGMCQEPPPVDDVARVIILTPPQTVYSGQEIQFAAVALDGDGNIVPGQSFSWSTSTTAVADIDADSGLAIGGDMAGSTDIVASVVGSSAAESAPVTLTNPGPPADDVARVTVVDASTGLAVEGAVVVRGADMVSTNANGVAEFDIAGAPWDVSVFDGDYNYVTLLGTSSLDLLVPLNPASGSGSTGGFTGGIDFSQVHTSGDINIGLAGASLDAELSNLNLQTLLGDSFNTSIVVPGLFEQDLPLPGGIVLFGTVFGFSLNVKDTYYARTPGGLKVGWSFGGLIEAASALDLAQGGGGGDIIQTILAFFEGFDHGVQPVEVTERALVADADDIDGDGDTAELIPDYEEFPTYDLTPFVEQDLRTATTLPALPSFAGADGFAIVVGGVINQGIGFVPLGLTVISDDDGDGTPDVGTLKVAPVHSGLSSGEYAVVAITFNADDFGADLESGLSLPENISVLTWTGAAIPTDLDFTENFVELSEAGWDGATRTWSLDEGTGTLYRVQFVGNAGSWEVWLDDGTASFTLPAPPTDFADWTSGAKVEVEAFAGNADVGVDDIAGAGGPSLRRVSQVSPGFSRAIIAP